MRINRGKSFDDFYGELQEEAKGEGPEATRDLHAKEVKYALINTLITRRRDLNLTQQNLAERSGIAQTEISRIERGRKSPTLDTFSRLASAMRLELRYGTRTSRRTTRKSPANASKEGSSEQSKSQRS
jgi:DNA-binding XRE family transcriptional regulator